MYIIVCREKEQKHDLGILILRWGCSCVAILIDTRAAFWLLLKITNKISLSYESIWYTLIASIIAIVIPYLYEFLAKLLKISIIIERY
jgi:hypothetical protein